MSFETVQQAIIEVLTEIQTISGREVVPMSGATCAIGDLPGFDSLNGIEATLEISTKLGYDFPVDNLLIDDAAARALTIGEIAQRVCQLLDTAAVTK
jgi:acyl carrier protein